MLNYNNSDVIQYLRQYDMFANSLNLIKTKTEKDMVIKQLSKLTFKILNLTNELYLEEYNALSSKECDYFEDEKNRLKMLIDLINQRISYVEKRCQIHYQLTGEKIETFDVLGVDMLDTLEERIKIIDKYDKNIKLEKELKEDVKSLSNKIALASEKMDINQSLNKELESVFTKTLDEAFKRFSVFDIENSRDNIEADYQETLNLLKLAERNLDNAKNNNPQLVTECEAMLNDIRQDYDRFNEEISYLKLLEIYNKETNTYEELLSKRKMVNEIIKCIRNREFVSSIIDMVSKQYNTILMEQQDINTFNDLVLEKERKLESLANIEDENTSEEFKSVLDQLIANERRRQEELIEEKKRIEEEEKLKRMELERKKQEEILKRQKIIEETRKKEIEKRTKQLLEEQQNSVLQTNKKISFETIKDTTNSDDKVEEFKTSKIENELFDEFNKSEKKKVSLDVFDKIDKSIDNNSLPDMSIDDYMNNFDAVKDDTVDLFNDTFPSIPV